MDQAPISEAPEMTRPYRYAIGVDRGATNIRVGLVRSDGRVLKLNKTEKLLLSMQDLTNAAEQLVPLIQEFLHLPEVSGLNLDGIAVSMAGVVNRKCFFRRRFFHYCNLSLFSHVRRYGEKD